MSTAITYDVHANRVGRWWEITVPDVYGDDPCGQAKHLTDVGYEARTIIAAKLDVPLSRVETRLIVDDFGDARDVSGRVRHISELRSKIERLTEELNDEQRSLVRELRRESVPDVDVATLLNVARQRIGQLAK
ncbi:hypothetical protein [Nocardia asteroides]|uniref:Uncharacterized protein n=1 Tax=Nocardia asteroides NBRC 15531 TaxID=1110697 RepID=U5E488_NOCAS|nr:hypothetical protein [Nocardia asteroides]TLF69770.1 hypothetical protein FEK33_05735 [Nocardia asteroides NBRC 15531]UGT49274.1 hypothetical protein LT345_01210 [Nocardia asteroides]SFL85593.1 hypothetical protein SAMN05444423_1011161 [Nocardia asteroides]VEG38361.1 Uncharacterised protein [Nocardia asteroides]GAD83857.1 hypothetical protein NCAST_20_04270 [Nocardia asteroides NBRC 15531]